MQIPRPFYLWIGAIVGASVLVYVLLPHGNLLRELSAVPIVVSLVAALVQLVRDEATHQRTVLLQENQNRFVLAASSHMANTAFDKHVKFCEEYVAEVQLTLHTLFRQSATAEVFRHTSKLSEIQERYVVWLTPRIETDLELFESALRKIGATAGLLRSGATVEDRRTQVTEMYKTLADVMGRRWFPEGWDGQPVNEELAVSKVIQRLRSVLGTEELTLMRTSLIARAALLSTTDG